MSPEERLALRTARTLLDLGFAPDAVLSNPLIPVALRGFVQEVLAKEQTVLLTPANTIAADRRRRDWTVELDRSAWHYWPTLRQHLLSKGWTGPAVRSLEDSSDRVLRQLAPPTASAFDTRGLVLGFIQSGKTANFTAAIAKAVDAGYRLIVVLSGVDNGLRLQTQRRLKRELVGYPDRAQPAVPLPPLGLRWHEFTHDTLDGDFQPGFANQAALQGAQPVLLVVKKNAIVLDRLITWFRQAPADVRNQLPMLLIDDEADQASIDTRGTGAAEDLVEAQEYEAPSTINGLIRQILTCFQRRSYVAYTATPFANLLIPHDTVDPTAQNDLYPKDFIIALPKPDGYSGFDELFGGDDAELEAAGHSVDLVESVGVEDIPLLETGVLPQSCHNALDDFVLAGAARRQRGQGDEPVTMLVHASQLIVVQGHLRALIGGAFADLRDSWRYHRDQGVSARLKNTWETKHRPRTRLIDTGLDVSFEEVVPHIGPFLEAVQIREVNSGAGDVIDYDLEPGLKVIAVGGNRLSRGLTLEGLVVSYFVRRSPTYDTLMQMGRWCGFRQGYLDLTRIYTTDELSGWFADLAMVESRLREDIAVYEEQEVTPLEVGMRIWQHPTMQVTSPLKRRFARDEIIEQNYSLNLEQTFKFPFERPADLKRLSDINLDATREFIADLGRFQLDSSSDKGPIWSGVTAEVVLAFLAKFKVDPVIRSPSIVLMIAYIEQLAVAGELVNWHVAIRGREEEVAALGKVDWGAPPGLIRQISRTRISKTNSLGVITSPGDELIGLTPDEVTQAWENQAEAVNQGRKKSINSVARELRSAERGLLLLYPISRWSGQGLKPAGLRQPLFSKPESSEAVDLIGLAISFPKTRQPTRVVAYLEGSVGWRPVE